jgi:hypothetical protein
LSQKVAIFKPRFSSFGVLLFQKRHDILPPVVARGNSVSKNREFRRDFFRFPQGNSAEEAL